MKELPKAYEPRKYEDKIYERWEKSGLFNPDVCVEKGVADKKAKPFSIVLPPPNVTGTLHLGQALMLSVQDLLVRYHRMKSDKTLWVPGTDHAAIATQTKVEKLLIQQGVKDPRAELGREKFLKEVNKFAQESHDIIVNQCRKMGASLDWTREAFTLDEQRNLAVRTMFKMMYDDGLIYRGHRIVNWCPRCHSTLADDEVEYKAQAGKLYTFRYADDFPFAISTTRPETKLGDTAVAVNPNDERYKKYIGKVFEVKKFAGGPDLKIKVIASEDVDTDFGTGALGVTPAHSFADYEMAQKNKLLVIKVIDEDGKITKEAGKHYKGFTVLEARARVLENLRELNLLEKEEDVSNNLSVCYRCESPVEPIPSKQWFIDVNKKFRIKNEELRIKGLKVNSEVTLKQLMSVAVKNGQIEIIPDRFNKTYFHWIDNLRDWCISRQIWYGHQIPVWYKGEEIFVDVEAPKGDGWAQDPDTLDTWFSSGLWTFSTLGWPDKTDDLKNFHPTSVMETGYDILFFWVARMILMTTYALGDIPFEKVYLHGLVRDEQGRKMSKSLGNAIDPLDMIREYGADAVRLSLLIGTSPGNDMKLSVEKIAGFRNFTNKLWNICRFMLMNIGKDVILTPTQSGEESLSKTLADKWILNRLRAVINIVTENIEKFNFSYAGERLRDFTWGDLADWYLEVAKIEGDKSEILNYILSVILRLWHPFMPFVTEQIWQDIYGKEKMLMVEKWPEKIKSLVDSSLIGMTDFDYARNIIFQLRSLRAEYKIEPTKKINVAISAGAKEQILKDNKEMIVKMAKIDNLIIGKEVKKPINAVTFFEPPCVTVFMDLAGSVDLVKEKERLKKEIEQTEKYVEIQKKKLANKEFVANAPAEIVEKEQQKLSECEAKLGKLKNQLKSLK
ncbi:valine--tRNA ligase [Patescibacteria group bacterium]|nr:MAG: valine--tRNA ligase [Patescibacteria group bacterium]